MLAGVDYTDYEENTRRSRSRTNFSPIDVYNPVYGVALPSTWTEAAPTTNDQKRTGVYLQDQVALGRWRLSLAGRHEKVDTGTVNRATGATTAQLKDEAFTQRYGVLYLFDNGWAPYASYTESFEPTAGNDFFGTPFKPTEGRQWELGVRYQSPATGALYSAALFDLRQVNNTMNDPDPTHLCSGTTCLVQTGELRKRGLELEAKVPLTRQWNLSAAYAYTDALYTSATSGAASPSSNLQGTRPINQPQNTFSLWSDYTLNQGPLAGLTAGGGIRYTGYMWLTPAANQRPNTDKIPDNVLVDAVLAYDLGRLDSQWRGAKVRLNVNNLFDQEWFPGVCAVAYCQYGEGRRVALTLSYLW